MGNDKGQRRNMYYTAWEEERYVFQHLLSSYLTLKQMPAWEE
jgi:hypothetical protein